MLFYIDPQTSEIVWRCPRCGASIRCQDLLGLDKLTEASVCEGCRARDLFESSPEMISFAVGMWARSDSWPASSIWMEAIPQSGISVLGADYHSHALRYPKRPALLSRTLG